MGKVIRYRDFNEMTIAFIFLGLTGVVFGSCMLFASISCASYNLNFGVGATRVMLDAMIHGSIFTVSGLLLIVLCSFSIFPIITKRKVDILWGMSILTIVASVLDIIKNLITGRPLFSMIVSVIALGVCCIIYYMINFTRKKMNQRVLIKLKESASLKKAC